MNWLVLILIALLVFFVSYVTYQAGKEKGEKLGCEKANWHALVKGITDPELELAWLDAVRKMYNIFTVKNSDYGRNTGAMGGVRGIALRLGDKVGRLWTLTGLSGESSVRRVQDESLVDTFLDVANYGIIGYLMITGVWPKSSVEAVIGKKAVTHLLIDAFPDLSEEARMELYAAFMTQEVVETMDASIFRVVT